MASMVIEQAEGGYAARCLRCGTTRPFQRTARGNAKGIVGPDEAEPQIAASRQEREAIAVLCHAAGGWFVTERTLTSGGAMTVG